MDPEVDGDAACAVACTCACTVDGGADMSSSNFSRDRLTRDSGGTFGKSFPSMLLYSSNVVESFSTCLLKVTLLAECHISVKVDLTS